MLSDILKCDTFSVLIDELDEDHRGVILLLKAIEDRLSAGAKDAAAEIARFLEIFVDDHFRREETVLARYGFPRLREHRKGHEEALARLTAFAAGLAAQGIIDGLNATESLKNHIVRELITEDLEYKWFFVDGNLNPRLQPDERETWEEMQARSMAWLGAAG